MLRFGERVLRKMCEVVRLELSLERAPVVPHIVEWAAKHMLELGCVKRPGMFRAAKPLDRLVDPVGEREVGKEAGAVEVAVGAALEIDLRPFAFETERREDAALVVHLRPPDHLVIAALGAAKAAGHP